MKNQFRRKLLINSGISVFILLLSSTASYLCITNLLDSNAWVRHTYEVIEQLDANNASLLQSQANLRGYIISGNEVYLASSSDIEEKAEVSIQKVAFLTQDNGRQQHTLKEFIPLENKFFTYINQQIDVRRKGTIISPEELETGRLQKLHLQDILKKMVNEEKRLLIIRIDKSEKYSSYSILLILAAAVLALGVTIYFFTRLVQDYSQRMKLQKELEDNKQETEKRIGIIGNIAAEVAQGNYGIRVNEDQKDTLGTVSASINDMASSLSLAFSQLSDKEWLQGGIAELNRIMIGDKSLGESTTVILNYLAEYTQSNAGVLYLINGDVLELSAGYSYNMKRTPVRLPLGQGIAGQAAVSAKMVEIRNIDPDQVTISYAMGEVLPGHIIAIPLIDVQVRGVIVLMQVGNFNARTMEFLRAATHNIAVALATVEGREMVQQLLLQTQAQSEELQLQHSELENINAELEAQTERLQASEEELRVQQEELQQTNDELAHRSDLLVDQNEEISQKSKQLELSTRYKSEFLANMSHELRTPLNSILLLSRLLSQNSDGGMSEEQVNFSNVIQNSGQGLLSLIDEILDLSKIESGRMDLEREEISLKAIISAMEDLFLPVAKEKGIEFIIDAKDAPMVIKTDRMRLEQILRNLISNALKFTEKGFVKLTIGSPESNKRITFSVADTGIGIPEAQQPLVFEAFQQADGSTKRKYGGTGLGLSISRELAKLLGGVITLESQPGAGSIFTLDMPLVAAESVPDSAPALQNNMEQTIPPPAARTEYRSANIPEPIEDDRATITAGEKCLLIVEDDTAFARSLAMLIKQRGYKVIATTRGDEALPLAIQYQPQGVLLDVELPVKNGWEALDELKSSLRARHIPVHIMSSHKVRQQSLLKGAVAFVDKPMAAEALEGIFKRIEAILAKDNSKVIIIEDNRKHAQALSIFLQANGIASEIRAGLPQGDQSLANSKTDCFILDMETANQNTYTILEMIKDTPGMDAVPVIVFTGSTLSLQEEARIKKYADSIVVKTAHSYQRMLDEVALFLHHMEEKKSGTKMIHDNLSGKNILVVDDDVRNIYSLTKSLEHLKINILTAIDGQEALQVLESHPDVDLVLLDMMMPNMDGYEAASRMRKDIRFKRLPIIAITAKAMAGDREKCIQAGASDYITKPVDVDQLVSLLRVWMD